MLYFHLAFAQEYFTLITRGQSLFHLPINMHCEVLESARQSIYVQSHLSHLSDNVNLLSSDRVYMLLNFPKDTHNPGKIFAKSPFSR